MDHGLDLANRTIGSSLQTLVFSGGGFGYEFSSPTAVERSSYGWVLASAHPLALDPRWVIPTHSQKNLPSTILENGYSFEVLPIWSASSPC